MLKFGANWIQLAADSPVNSAHSWWLRLPFLTKKGNCPFNQLWVIFLLAPFPSILLIIIIKSLVGTGRLLVIDTRSPLVTVAL